MEFGSWKTDFDTIFPHLQRVALGRRAVNVLAIGDRIAFGLPDDGDLANEVVNMYRPMKWRARKMASLVKTFVKMGGAKFLKSRSSKLELSEISWLNSDESLGFLGCNPRHGFRCVFLSSAEGQQIRVTKLAIGSNIDPIVAEAKWLQENCGEYPGVPKFGGCETGLDWAAFWTNYISQPGPLELGGEAEIELLRSWLQPARVRIGDLCWMELLLKEMPAILASSLMNEVVCEALIHGDFTSWNLRSNESGLVAIDWEWARVDGIGGLDLGHGLIMEAVFVKGLRGEDLVNEVLIKIEREEPSSYLKECGWGNVNLWMALALQYAGKQTGLDVGNELDVLKNRVEHSA
ncbi:hypothetical protein N9A94_00705 [Akkermansiaceae bacterium]|nr:hypothetical protein [Akkermansiaceae bacterium]MDA7887863.1 hypothetical protein [Akkermansiaceae bacterium]MDB4544806.1 hypothetical protein [Akkermansiaceae bacterium]